MEQTAVGLAIELIKKDYQVNGKLRLAYVMQVLEQAKEIEKQQIIDAYQKGQLDLIEDILIVIPDDIIDDFEDAEQYYNETFKQQ